MNHNECDIREGIKATKKQGKKKAQDLLTTREASRQVVVPWLTINFSHRCIRMIRRTGAGVHVRKGRAVGVRASLRNRMELPRIGMAVKVERMAVISSRRVVERRRLQFTRTIRVRKRRPVLPEHTGEWTRIRLKMRIRTNRPVPTSTAHIRWKRLVVSPASVLLMMTCDGHA